MSPVPARIATILLLSLALPARPSFSQDDFIASRQADTTRYAKLLFHVDFNDGYWTHRRLQACSSFTHHAFAVFERTSASGTDRILVTYNLDTPPAKPKDRPWRGGIIAAQLGTEWGADSGTRPDEANLVTLFNRLLADERRSPQSAVSAGGSQDLATCFAALAGEEPVSPPQDSSPAESTAIPQAISGSTFAVKSSGPAKRFQVIRFDTQGLVEYARVVLDRFDTP